MPPPPPHTHTQVLRYAFPFMFISACFWLLHTWILDPMPNAFRRREFLRFRREMMHVASKLNFRSPARQVGGCWPACRTAQLTGYA